MKPKYSWIVVAIMLWCIFPVGVYMLVQNITNSGGRKRKTPGQGVKIVGIVFIVLAVLYAFVIFILSIASDGYPVFLGAIPGAFVFMTVGIILIIIGKRRALNMDMFERYLNILGTHSMLPLSVFCSVLGKTQAQVERDLQLMMKQGFFRGCYIDRERGVFVTPNSDPFEQSGTVVHKHTRVYKCKNCGATKVVQDGDLPVCDYCGSGLE